MLPDGKEARLDYIRARDQRSIHRNLTHRLQGDEALLAQELMIMGMEAEMSGLREQMDFLVTIDGLKPHQVEALTNAIAWGEAFLQTLVAK